jgi:hypothetical protein
MKKLLYVVISILTLSCASDVADQLTNTSGIVKYSINRHNEKSNTVMSVKYDAGKATVTRLLNYSVDPEAEYNVVYFNPDLVDVGDNGSIVIKPTSNPVWFVPANLGVDPINLMSNLRCWKYYCNCGGAPSPDQHSACSINKSAEGIIRCFTSESEACPPNTNEFCLGSAAIVPCNMAPEDNENKVYYEHYFGGIIIEASEVVVADPPGFKKKQNNTLDFIGNDTGEMYLKEDFERLEKEKLKPQN